MLGADCGELSVIKSLRCIHEDVKSAVGLNCIKTCIYDVCIKKVSSVLVVSDVNLCVDGLLNDFLPDCRSVYASERSVGKNDGACKLCIVSALGRYESITDSFARK